MRLFLQGLIVLVLINFSIYSDDDSHDDIINKYNREKGKILNLILNSPQFDTLYNSDQVYICENDLMPIDIPIKLYKNKCLAQIKELSYLENHKLEYIVLGDFTTDIRTMLGCRVQLSNPLRKKNLNVYLRRENNLWRIRNYMFFDDD